MDGWNYYSPASGAHMGTHKMAFANVLVQQNVSMHKRHPFFSVNESSALVLFVAVRQDAGEHALGASFYHVAVLVRRQPSIILMIFLLRWMMDYYWILLVRIDIMI